MPQVDNSLLLDWRDHYVNIIVSVLAVFGVFGLVASLSRLVYFGWLDIFYLHISGSLLLILLFVYRHKLSTDQKCAVLIVASLVAGLAGTVAFGLAGTGIIYVINTAIFSAIFVNRKLASVIIVGIMLFVAYIGYLYSTQVLKSVVDLNEYVGSYSSWLATLFGPIMISAIFVLVISKIRGRLVSTMFELEKAKAELSNAANHDSLTGLANLRHLHVAFQETSENMRREGDPFALMLLDLDDFKKMNDEHGHMAADKLLKEIANRIRASIRASDVAARIGGDEFVILLRNVKQEQDVVDIAQKLVKSINSAYEIENGKQVFQGLSIGATIRKEPTNEDLEACLKDADASMYHLKNMGKNGFYLSESQHFRDSLTGADSLR